MTVQEQRRYINTREDSAIMFLGIPTLMRATGDTTNGAFGLMEQWMMPPGFASLMQTGMVQPSGPSIHFCTSSGSVWARYTASGGAAKRRVTTTCRSPSVFSVNLLMVCLSLLRIYRGKDLVQPAVVRF